MFVCWVDCVVGVWCFAVFFVLDAFRHLGITLVAGFVGFGFGWCLVLGFVLSGVALFFMFSMRVPVVWMLGWVFAIVWVCDCLFAFDWLILVVWGGVAIVLFVLDGFAGFLFCCLSFRCLGFWFLLVDLMVAYLFCFWFLYYYFDYLYLGGFCLGFWGWDSFV